MHGYILTYSRLQRKPLTGLGSQRTELNFYILSTPLWTAFTPESGQMGVGVGV